MSVTQKKRKEDPLTLYVDFLNVDLSADPRPKLKKGQKLMDFLDQFERDTLPCKFNLLTGEPVSHPCPRNWLEEAKDLRGEMKNDLFPIAARKEIPEKLFPLLERWVYLTEKLNEMGFRRRWDTDTNQKGQIIVKGWNFKSNYNQRDIWYLGLAQRLEDGDLERLRLCAVCRKYFAARDRRQRWCGHACKTKHDNEDSKFRVKRWRAKREGVAIRKEEERQNEQRVNKFAKFVKLAISNSQDTENVGPMMRRLGQGDGKKGWKIIDECNDKLKNGISPLQIFNDLPQAIKNCFL